MHNVSRDALLSDLAAITARLSADDAHVLDPLPDRQGVGRLVARLGHLLFPRHLPAAPVDGHLLAAPFWDVAETFWDLTRMLHAVRPHECPGSAACGEIRGEAERALRFLNVLPEIREELRSDADAAYRGDPAAHSRDEIIATYPGFLAVLVYRLAHVLDGLGVELLPRMMTEWAHGRTGIDIHPAARIGPRFFIDHGTGVVIGETTVIGAGVTLYQGVTLGALNFPRDGCGNIVRGQKRHPTIEDGVVIYAEATILGGDTVVGAYSEIGGNVWLTHGVPAQSRVVAPARLELKEPRPAAEDRPAPGDDGQRKQGK